MSFTLRCLIAFVVLALSGVAEAAPSDDETLDPGAAAFYAVTTSAADGNNVAIGLLGLGAPSGQDFMAHGRAIAAASAPVSFAEAQTRTKDPKALTIKWDQDRMYCWTDDYAPFDEDPKCAPLAEAAQTLHDNVELLSRFRQVQKMPPAWGMTQDLVRTIDVTKLTAIEIKVAIRQGRTEEAYRKCVDLYAFWRRMNSAGRTWVEVAIGLVNEGISLRALESLLLRAPQVIDRHYDELLVLLTPEIINRFNFPEIARAEYTMVMKYYQIAENKSAILPNYLTNRHYRYAQQLMEIAGKPASELNVIGSRPCKCLKPVELNENDPGFTASAAFIGPTVFPGVEFIKSMHDKIRMAGLLTMRIKIAKDKVPDSEIAAYLAANAKDMREPFTNDQMQWDPVRRRIFFDTPVSAATAEVRL